MTIAQAPIAVSHSGEYRFAPLIKHDVEGKDDQAHVVLGVATLCGNAVKRGGVRVDPHAGDIFRKERNARDGALKILADGQPEQPILLEVEHQMTLPSASFGGLIQPRNRPAGFAAAALVERLARRRGRRYRNRLLSSQVHRLEEVWAGSIGEPDPATATAIIIDFLPVAGGFGGDVPGEFFLVRHGQILTCPICSSKNNQRTCPMPTPAEIAAAVTALHARREKSRTALTKWPDIEEEVRIVLEAAERVRDK